MTARGDIIEPVLAALADPTRRQVLDLIAARESVTATTIAAELPVSRQAVVKHLAILEKAGLVDGNKEGREVRYTVRSERLDDASRWMTELAAEWDARLARIKHLAESSPLTSVPDTESR
jgi:DNA-binding transcriptional ArsR family regulator